MRRKSDDVLQVYAFIQPPPGILLVSLTEHAGADFDDEAGQRGRLRVRWEKEALDGEATLCVVGFDLGVGPAGLLRLVPSDGRRTRQSKPDTETAALPKTLPFSILTMLEMIRMIHYSNLL